ncbi:MAG: hypothetical protein GF364_03040 [Candidatus Lokiarchaeota archaeon]|nr:hypothetical protein [Candidatus Lokiarchaeota archaeon]
MLMQSTTGPYGMMIFTAVLLVVFYIQAFKKHYRMPYLLSAVTSGALGTTIRGLAVLSNDSTFEIFTNVMFFFFLSLTIVFFFFFIESCSSLKPNIPQVILIISLFIIGQAFNFLRFLLFLDDEILNIFLVMTLAFYGLLGIIGYGIFGIRFYLGNYKLTREKMPIFLTIGMVIALITYSLICITSLVYWGYPTGLIGDVVPILSTLFIAVFSLSYVFNIDYVYRLPYDYYGIMVYVTAGLQIFKADLESRRDVTIETNLISGFLTAFNSLFAEALSAKDSVENISSKDSFILIKTGDYVSVVVVGEIISAKLNNAVFEFLDSVENEYHEELENFNGEITGFSGIEKLIPKCFPFFKIKRVE